MGDGEVKIEPMRSDDIESAAALVARSMNPSEGAWARVTMNRHFECVENKIDDGRHYYVWRKENSLVGLVGLHHYHWGPESNVWLSWFAVDPQLQGHGYGRALLNAVEKLARGFGYRKFLVETYAQEDFARARRFYKSMGFEEKGKIADYLDDGSAMIVYGKRL